MNTSPVRIGNDVVDLSEPRVACKDEDARFMERVFTPRERRLIRAAAGRARALWALWAAKETAFKIASKRQAGLIFAHAAFEVYPEGRGDGAVAGRVKGAGLVVEVRWEHGVDCLHCVGIHAPGPRAGRLEMLFSVAEIAAPGPLEPLSPEEQISALAPGSARARHLARGLLTRLGRPQAKILRRPSPSGWGPPFVAIDGLPAPDCDVSLSHDGRFAAAAVLALQRDGDAR